MATTANFTTTNDSYSSLVKEIPANLEKAIFTGESGMYRRFGIYEYQQQYDPLIYVVYRPITLFDKKVFIPKQFEKFFQKIK
jgi:hypothetical protein